MAEPFDAIHFRELLLKLDAEIESGNVSAEMHRYHKYRDQIEHLAYNRTPEIDHKAKKRNRWLQFLDDVLPPPPCVAPVELPKDEDELLAETMQEIEAAVLRDDYAGIAVAVAKGIRRGQAMDLYRRQLQADALRIYESPLSKAYRFRRDRRFAFDLTGRQALAGKLQTIAPLPKKPTDPASRELLAEINKHAKRAHMTALGLDFDSEDDRNAYTRQNQRATKALGQGFFATLWDFLKRRQLLVAAHRIDVKGTDSRRSVP